jgi:hypothetical protein
VRDDPPASFTKEDCIRIDLRYLRRLRLEAWLNENWEALESIRAEEVVRFMELKKFQEEHPMGKRSNPPTWIGKAIEDFKKQFLSKVVDDQGASAGPAAGALLNGGER